MAACVLVGDNSNEVLGCTSSQNGGSSRDGPAPTLASRRDDTKKLKRAPAAMTRANTTCRHEDIHRYCKYMLFFFPAARHNHDGRGIA